MLDPTRRLEILLVEDNPGDVRLAREALREWEEEPRLRVAGDGVEALEMLEREGGPAGPPPDLILLDLNLPRLNGRELLRSLKSSPVLRRIPVIVLSSSDAEDDIRAAYDLQANCYLVKPRSLERYLDVIRGIERFWSQRVALPMVAS